MAARGSTAGLGLLKRGWHQVPDLVVSLALTVVGVGLTTVYIASHDWDRDHQYKPVYTVIREEEVRNQEVRKKYYN